MLRRINIILWRRKLSMLFLIVIENNIMKYKITYKYNVHYPDPRGLRFEDLNK